MDREKRWEEKQAKALSRASRTEGSKHNIFALHVAIRQAHTVTAPAADVGQRPPAHVRPLSEEKGVTVGLSTFPSPKSVQRRPFRFF